MDVQLHLDVIECDLFILPLNLMQVQASICTICTNVRTIGAFAPVIIAPTLA
jgi:hypothetical protein